MGSRSHRVDFYDPKTLEAVSQAFDAIWNVPRDVRRACEELGLGLTCLTNEPRDHREPEQATPTSRAHCLKTSSFRTLACALSDGSISIAWPQLSD
jgi:hypothetical protein